ncbi:MAG: hypothetical protein OEY87_06605, partial [Gammaproteobacteria bacterium]|nr:hypothetical protein [Gammaproteobacteria bacterium]
GSIALSGAGHQAEYDKYNNASAYVLTITGVVSTPQGTSPETYNSTMTFTITHNGSAYVDAGLSGLAQKRYYASLYDSTTRRFNFAFSYANPTATGTPGEYTVTATGKDFAPESSNAQVYAYIAAGALDTEGMTLYEDVANAGLAFGDANTYVSAANVTACEGCHGTPYMKHGYRAAQVAGLSDFGGCKSCHVDTTNGTHPDWQLLADDPARYAELDALAKACPDTSCDSIRENMTADELSKYAYTRRIMNDVHMSHNMEFPYPQEMFNCATCHEGKLTGASGVLADTNYEAETCISCHAIDNLEAKMLATALGVTVHQGFLDAGNLKTQSCNVCHYVGGAGPALVEIHTGYNPEIYADATGLKFSDAYIATVDDASFDSATNILTINFSVTEVTPVSGFAVDTVVPTVLVGLYGYDTKHFIVAPHGRDADRNRLLEFPIDGTTVNPRFEIVSAAGGAWEVTADLSMWADMIAEGAIKRAEIGFMPALGVNGPLDVRNGTGEYADDVIRAMDAPSRTFDLTTNAFDDGYYPDVVKVDGGCNNCHDALATTFHSGNRGGNIKICKMCHEPSSAGSHLEMQSRSIDSYVHAIHSFQAFDPGDIDFTDPVAALEYEHHVNHTYPNFTIKNCESCHNPGTYDVPDQSKSLPGVLSGSDNVADRNIGTVPSYVTGPASRACGSCHRADMINADDAAALGAFNGHTKTFGYLVENGDSIWDTIVEKVMSMF